MPAFSAATSLRLDPPTLLPEKDAPMFLYLHELRALTKTLLLWTGLVALLLLVGTPKFAAYYHDPELLRLLDAMPRPLLDALNMRAFNLTTVAGFLGVMYLYFTLFGALVGALLGHEVVAREEDDRTADFTLTLPLSRRRLLAAKLGAALTHLALFVALMAGLTWAATRPFAPSPAADRFLALEMAATFLVGLVFLAWGFVTACAFAPRFASSLNLGFLLTLYFLSLVQGLHEKLHFLKYFTPFEFFDAHEIYRQGRLLPGSVVATVVLFLALVMVGFWIYAHRDVAA